MSTESRRPVDRWYPPRSNPLASRSLPSILQGFHGGPLALAEPAVAPRRDGQPAARRGDGRALGAAAVCGDDPPLRRRGDFRQDRRECARPGCVRSEEHTSELQSRLHLVCRLLLEKKKI